MAIIGNALSVLALKANIYVTTRAGATVRFIRGGSTMATLTADSGGHCNYEILIPSFGAWTVTSTSGSATGSTAVTVSDTRQYNVTVTQRQYFIQDGNFVSGVTHWVYGRGAGFEDAGSYIHLNSYMGGSNDYATGYMMPWVYFDGYWKSLVIDSQETGNGSYVGLTSYDDRNPADFVASAQMSGRLSYLNSRHTSSCNVSGVRGTYHPAILTQAWLYIDSGGVSGSPGEVNIWNMYLSG